MGTPALSSRPTHDADPVHAPHPAGAVVVRLRGGLGNQLFQYAAGRAVSLRSGLPLSLDASAFESDGLRAYRLGHFGVVQQFASETEIARLAGPRLLRRLGRFAPLRPRHWVEERHFHFDPDILRIRSPVYLSGYWQSEKYFSDVAHQLRSELRVTSAPDETNAKWLGRIGSTESVALHVRRGDYVANARARRLHGLCGVDYYRAAIGELTRRFRAPRFFVFSDDLQWAADNLASAGDLEFVDANGPGRDCEDLRLMSRCRHHVIANSTFSWWGAWLAQHPAQVVIAPRSWFAARTHDPRDVYADGWLKL